jgi:hypothetical protein
MAKLADAAGLKPAGRKAVGVRTSLPACEYKDLRGGEERRSPDSHPDCHQSVITASVARFVCESEAGHLNSRAGTQGLLSRSKQGRIGAMMSPRVGLAALAFVGLFLAPGRSIGWPCRTLYRAPHEERRRPRFDEAHDGRHGTNTARGSVPSFRGGRHRRPGNDSLPCAAGGIVSRRTRPSILLLCN